MKHIVTVGGGTGSYTILSGLKNISGISITALVSMADNGGSTGVLRDELGVLPPGDVRQCLVALSDHSDIMRTLMNYRFEEGTLKGHSFGNIFIAALEKMTGDFLSGVEAASEILKVKGTVIPVTSDNAELYATLGNGKLVKGQVEVAEANFSDKGLKEIFYKNKVSLNKGAREALLEADYIILGPGNFYCSVVPNLIVSGFKEMIKKSSAKIILPVNLTNKQEHTKNWKVSDYVANIEKYLGKKVDLILLNNESPTKEQVKAYQLEEGDGVLVEDDLEDKRVIRKPLLSHVMVKFDKSDVRSHARSFIRHDPKKIARYIESIIKK
jgi:uncharacterized cofD-like protein